MTIGQVHADMKDTDICAFGKDSWNKESIIISMKFNGVLYPKFIAINNSDFKGVYNPSVDDLLSNDFVVKELTLAEKADYFKRFYIFSTSINAKKNAVPTRVEKPYVLNEVKLVDLKKPLKENVETKPRHNTGTRREIVKAKKSKFRTGVLFVSMHYSFGSQSLAPMDMRAFAFRAGRRKSKNNNIEIKNKDFELNDTELINGRFYIDQEIRKNGYDIELSFAQADYEFIKVYGPRMWIKVTGYKSGFKYEENTREVIDRYFDVSYEHSIVKSFSKRVIVDTNPYSESVTLDSRLIAKISNFKN